ncbi:hypothetical protein Rhe02_81130 [Rhizocola hellebori]|uniref:Uncharacterized protein n=1 Tax=Rhizocola hellebori TaxID=1392758 RepID=A0A8J3VLH6_9ACTN|nr:hypothetical protein Rhe02_81130 [Rhizocola hellebori]
MGRDGEKDAIDVKDPRWGFVRSDGWGSTGLSGRRKAGRRKAGRRKRWHARKKCAEEVRAVRGSCARRCPGSAARA